ncbi:MULTISPECIES: helix-turn-helix domain-containing protein [Streptomyces]|uniref:LuxR C-terminal-related transcriptional regulator n=1 Tax=Streptomyces TaxID=1883 RepID=UPI00025CCD91|nr:MULTISPECIES: LuxR C-terminal-related transcriptional regulator [Streptomyces]AZK97919.1 LuxR family transcriptional regulator [Streptomyces tsukubensis]EIF94164.1 LuxR family transcriptional regulator [Streptomyces tsukubensis NRRL18488]
MPVATSGEAGSEVELPRPGGTDDPDAAGSAGPDDAGGSGGVGLKRLTALDVCILEGVAVGTSTVQLAASLYLSRQGIEYRIGLLLRQFQVANRTALVSRAHSLGVLSVGTWPPRVLPPFLE